jgi:hypothetical protein
MKTVRHADIASQLAESVSVMVSGVVAATAITYSVSRTPK